MQVLGGLPHHRGALVDQPLGDEARVEVDVVTHRVMAHVLHAAGEDEVGGAHGDLAGGDGRGRQRSRAHAVDRHPRHGVGETGEERDVTTERQPLVADLGGRGEDDVADPLGRSVGNPPQHLAHRLHGHVVGAGRPEETTGPRLAEGGADTVDVDDLAEGAWHEGESRAMPFSYTGASA